jgi:hypothetical protein
MGPFFRLLVESGSCHVIEVALFLQKGPNQYADKDGAEEAQR